MDPFRVLSTADFNPEVPGYRKRIKHKKTTTGCRICKAKRVKCDETRPVCRRCKRNGWECGYSSQPPPGVLASPLVWWPLSHNGGTVSRGTPDAQLLHHWHLHWDSIFPGFARQGGFQAAFHASSLIRSVCHAMAASHLRHHCPDYRPHILAEYSHFAVTLDEYKQHVMNPRDLGQSGCNRILLGAILFNILAFPLSPVEKQAAVDHNSPWCTTDHDTEIGWLTVQSGLGPLMDANLIYFPQAVDFISTIWAFQQPLTYDYRNQPSVVPKLWARFFKLEEDHLFEQPSMPHLTPSPVSKPPPLADAVRGIVRMTAELRALEPTHAHSVRYLVFLFKAQWGFRALLAMEDPRAWWIYGYWAGLMRRFPSIWWCRERAERQYAAAKSWLGRVDMSDETELWAQMMCEYERASVWPPTELETV